MSFSSNKTAPNNIDLNSSQTLSNKTLDSSNVLTTPSIESPSRLDVKKDTLANLVTYASTASNGQMCFATDVKNMYQVVDSALAEVGSGGTGGINYLEGDDSNFEDGTGTWTDDTNITISQETTSPLRGSGSLKIVKASGANYSTQTVNSPTITVAAADLAKKLTISFDYDFSDANYADGYARLQIKQDPAGTPTTVRVNGEDIKAGKGTHYAQFQTDSTLDTYQVEIYWVNTGTTAVSAYIDNVSVGPTNLAFGTIVTDPINYTPTITGGFVLGNGTINSSWYARKGKFLSGRIDITVGTTTTISTLVFTLPPGLAIDDTIDSGFPNYGQVTFYDAGTSFYDGYVFRNTNTQLVVYGKDAASSVVGTYVQTATLPFTWASGDSISIIIDNIPIVGWSSNAQISEDLGGREVLALYNGNGSTTIAGSTAIPFTNKEKDTTNSWSGTEYTTPETGTYLISYSVHLIAKSDYHGIWVDGGQHSWSENASSSDIMSGSKTIYLTKGQTVSVRFNNSTTLVSGGNHRISITKLASPQTILETETVAARYTSSNAENIPSATWTIVDFEELSYDTHGATTTGASWKFTAPVNGTYSVRNLVVFSPAAWLVSEIAVTSIYKNGSLYSFISHDHVDASVTREIYLAGCDTIELSKGDYIDIRVYQNSGIAIPLATESTKNHLSIERIK